MGRIDTFQDLGCLVTGASSGIGRDIARLLADEGARIAITARRADRLQELETELEERGARAVYVIVADLAAEDGPASVARQAEDALGAVDVLVNNAGFAVPGMFGKTSLERNIQMLDVNIRATLELTRLLLPDMVKRDKGGVMTVASVAAFQAAPYQTSYAATKAFGLNFSDGIHQEYKFTNLAITALCPGVTDTEFFEAAGYRKLSKFMNRRMPSMRVAKIGVRAFKKGKMEVVPGFLNKLAIFAQRIFPRRFVASLSRRLLGGRQHPAR